VNEELLSPELDTVGPLHWLGIGLAAISAVVHLVLGVQFLPSPMGAAFVVATIGFLAGIALVVANVRRPAVFALGIPFTLGQIALWLAITRPELLTTFDPTVLGPVEVVDKSAQVVLVVVLVVLFAREFER